VDSLINDLDHENESIRNAAMESLSGIGDEDTMSSLMQVANNNSNTVEKRKNAIKVLGTIGNDHASELLLNISLNQEEEKIVRMSSILALGDIGNETMIKTLGNLSYGDDGLVLYHAAYVLDQTEENKEDVYASYGKLPYPLSEEQRTYRNNLSELHEIVDKNLPVIENATTMFSGYNIKSGYIEIASDIEPKSSEMDEIYKVYDTEARKLGINQIPVRFVQCESPSSLEYWYNVSDFNINIKYVYTWSNDDDDVKSQIFIP
jgi:hypothetical protein